MKKNKESDIRFISDEIKSSVSLYFYRKLIPRDMLLTCKRPEEIYKDLLVRGSMGSKSCFYSILTWPLTIIVKMNSSTYFF